MPAQTLQCEQYDVNTVVKQVTQTCVDVHEEDGNLFGCGLFRVGAERWIEARGTRQVEL